MKHLLAAALLATTAACSTADSAPPPAAGPASTVTIDSPMAAPKWAQMERQLLAENVPAAREFFQKYFDDRGYLLVFVRWGANDGPDDAFENFNHWPELHALGASDEIVQMYLKGNDGMIKQYTEAKTTKAVPAGVDGMYYKEFSALSDWQHHGEGLQLFNRMALSVPTDAKYLERVRRFSGFYMGEDPEAPNYDPKHKIIRSMMNGSKGPLLRKATSVEWVGEPFDMDGLRRPARRTELRRVPRALPGVPRRRRRSRAESRRHHAARERLLCDRASRSTSSGSPTTPMRGSSG